jgi:hypothetical protein
MCHCEPAKDSARVQATRNLSRRSYATISYPDADVSRFPHRSCKQVLCGPKLPQKLWISKDVSILRADHFAIQVILLGVREVVARKSAAYKARVSNSKQKEINMLWTIFVVILIMWLLGFSLHVGGGLIHLLLVIALVVLVVNLVSGRRLA